MAPHFFFFLAALKFGLEMTLEIMFKNISPTKKNP